MLSDSELVRNALKRVCALAGVKGKLHVDNTGFYVLWDGAHPLSNDAMSSGEMLSYLHGVEDAYLRMKKG